MQARVFLACAALTVGVGFAVERTSKAQTDLSVTYGANGVQRVGYRGVALEDLAQSPNDAFHIWHMKMTDLNGNVLSGPQNGWGESNNGRRWDAGSQTWTYSFAWGSIQVQFQQAGNTLNMNVMETNNPGSGAILSGAEIFPFVLHFPALPNGFTDQSYPQLSYNTTGPSVLTADFGSGLVAAVVPDASKPLYSGFLPAGQPNAYTPLISSTTPDGLATFQPHNDRPVLPGQTDHFTVSLRFAPSATPPASLAQDAYSSWARTWPAALNWTDRRIIGTAYLASSPAGKDATRPGGYPNNPRRYFNSSNASDFDVNTPGGLRKFQDKVLAQAASTVANLRRLNAQAVITWDIEGEQYPQETSYVCSPDQIAGVAPEMESPVSNASSPYAGMKLDDAYFKTIRDAGFRVGLCVRPQNFTLGGNGSAQQVYLPDNQIAAQLIRKMKYAHDRWGATVFYLDSTVETNGAVLDASIFQQAAAALPDSLLIPEETTPKFYAYTAPFKTFLFHGDLGTDPSVYGYYGRAFSANLINDVDPGKLAAAQPQLTASVRAGDVLMVHADYWQANNDTVLQIYSNAGAGASVPAPAPAPVATAPAPPPPVPVATPPAPAPPVVVAPAPVAPAPQPPAPVASYAVAIITPGESSTVSGAITVAARIGVALDPAGSYLMVDGMEVGTRRVVDGPYQYPLDTTALSNGQHTLQVWAHDTANDTVLSGIVHVNVANGAGVPQPAPAPVAAPVTTPVPAPVATSPAPAAPLPVANAPVQLTYPQSGQAVSGVVSVLAAISPALDAAGSYLLVDGAEAGWKRVGSAPYVYDLDTSGLSAGAHTLQVWAHTIANDSLLSNVATIIVTH